MLGLKFLWLLNPDDKKSKEKKCKCWRLQIWLYHPLNQSLVHKLDLKYCTDMSPLVMSPACFIISILNDAKLKSLQALRVHLLLGVRNCQLTYKCRWICHEQITPLILHPNHFHFIGTMSDHCLLLSLTNSCHAYMYSNMVRALMVIQLQPLYEIVRIVMGWNGCWCLHKKLYSAVYIPQWQSSVLSLQKFSNESSFEKKTCFPFKQVTKTKSWHCSNREVNFVELSRR